jgi:hemerythrin-like domain-containing protein
MQATDILMAEHDVIQRVLTALETGAQRLEAGQAVRAGFFTDAADFIKGFADGCHHRKEEGVLFKELEAAGLPAQSGPIAVMLMEHEEGRAFTRGMRAAAEKMAAGDATARSAVVTNAQGYVELLRQHIAKENNILFPMAGQMIPKAKQAGVVDAFEHVEHEETGAGVHEKYLALAERLEKEAAAL